METTDDTGFGGIRLIQDTEGFRYGIDAVLLADYAKETGSLCRSAAELGCGNGIVSLLLAGQRQDRHVTGIEFQSAAARLARRSAALNGMEDRVSILECDIASLKEDHPELAGTFDLVVSNPPYIARGSGIPGARKELFFARQETTADLDTFIEAAAWLLQRKGTFCMVHRPFRLVDIMCSCRKHRLEPKRIRFVHPKEGEPPNIVLLQCSLNGGKELVYDNPLYVYGEDGKYSQQVMRIYGKNP